MSASAFDTLVCALGTRRTHNQAVGIVMENRHIGPDAADRHLRERAVFLGVCVATAAALVVRAHEEKRDPGRGAG
jgi:AmiR/NasT family two-component response regulator